uniref:hypothetical protein n=1 Tax=Acinetobacter baumannii TaxID=470 RepID=UPI001C075E39
GSIGLHFYVGVPGLFRLVRPTRNVPSTDGSGGGGSVIDVWAGKELDGTVAGVYLLIYLLRFIWRL